MIKKLLQAVQDSDWYFRLFCRNKPKLRIEGVCKMTGNCCRNLILVDGKRPVDSLQAFERLKQKISMYSMFIPNEEQIPPGELPRFTCSNLREDHTCGIYETRASDVSTLPALAHG